MSKHAGTGEARVVLAEAGGDVVVCVEDDGAGFDASALGEAGDGFGLASVRERVEAVGGRFGVESAPGNGTRVTLAVPCLEGGGA